jgi:RNA polymerase sigma-70 factor (ECF subfamily)
MNQADQDWNAVVEDIGPPLFRFFCASFDQAQASDLVQETLIRLVQKSRSGAFDGTRSSLKSFAFGIARFVRLERLKLRVVQDELIGDEQMNLVPDASPQADSSDECAHLRWAVGHLSQVEQEVVSLSIDEDLGLNQIAIDLNLPVGTVKSHLFRARQKLRTLLKDDL